MKHYLLLSAFCLVFAPFVRAQDTTKVTKLPDAAADISTVTLDLEDENKDQSISGLLNASQDIFVSTAGYTFGSMFFRQRGYDSENSEVMINNIGISDAENGRVVWSNWGGLNDAMRNKEVFPSLNVSPYSYSMIGGMTYINTRASDYRKQLKVSYSLTDRTYRNRVMLTYATGQLKKGWAVTLSGSRRWSQEGYIQGTFYDAWSYFLAVEKKFGAKHSLALTVFGAPTKRGQQSASYQEAYDLVGSNYYNPNWGYQNGEKRNAKVKNFHEPVMVLNHFWNINTTTKLTTALGYMFGTDAWSALNWYNAADPRPDYYRYLPSYQTDPAIANMVTNSWDNNITTQQINWDHLYQVNYLSNGANKQARYIVENNITKYNQISFNTHLEKEFSDHITFTSGLNFRLYEGRHYKEMLDLLGGNFWIDIDQFAEQDYPTDRNMMQNDLNNPNRVIREGDRFGYDYSSNINTGQLWAQGKFTYSKLDFYVAGSLSETWFWRTGYMKNGRHPDNSFGKSATYSFTNFGLRGGITWKISGRHYANANGFYMTRAPFFNSTYISPKVRDDVVTDPTSEKIYGGDVSYIMRYPTVNARLTYYYTQFRDGTDIMSYYHDDYRTYVNYSMVGVDKLHQGIEFGIDVKLIKVLTLYGVAAIGDYRYTSRPMGTISADNGSFPDTAALVYQKNFYVPTTPQTALSGGVKFNYKYWWVDVNANYYNNDWMDFFPGRRTEQAIQNLGPGDPKIAQITEQTMLKGGFTMDASVGKSIMIKHKYFINLNLQVTNILDNKDINSGGYESNRFDFVSQDVDKYQPKLYYYYGRTFYLSVSFRMN
jgi:hypothetical protein